MTPNKQALIRQAEAAFHAKTRDLSPRALEMRLRAMASKATGNGPDEIDPIQRELAQQRLDFIKLQTASKQNAEAQEHLRRSPSPLLSRAEQLAALEKLELEAARILGQAESIVDRPLGRAADEAIALHQETEAAAARDTALRAAAEAKAAELAVDPGAVDALALALASRR